MSELPQIDIEAAAERIAGICCRSPLKPALDLSQRLGRSVHLKLETAQATGSFKLRGAANKILALEPSEQRRGLTTASAGNHGRAVAYVARKLGLRAVICLSRNVPGNKVRAIAALGAEVIVEGGDYDEAYAHARKLARKHALIYIHAFDDPLIVAGQATIGREILMQRPQVDTVLVPVSGGSLAGGVAMALKRTRPQVRVIGISMERGPAMHASLEAGRPVEVQELPTLADALAGGIGLDNRVTFPLVQRYLDELRLVSEEQIAAAMGYAFHEQRLVLEGAGACALVLLLEEPEAVPGKDIVVICSGDNVDTKRFMAIVERYTPEAGEPAGP